MADFINNLKNNFKRGSVFMQFIYINVGVFLLIGIPAEVLKLFNRGIEGLTAWFALPAPVSAFLLRPWTLITYMFMHDGLLHLLFNMLWLYWFGALFLRFFSAKHLRGLYVLGGICGGLLYILAFNTLPLFKESLEVDKMVGASASILAIVTAVAWREPDYPLRLLLLGTVRIKYLALGVVAIDLLTMATSNSGGHIAHLGGALSGVLFAWCLERGTDLVRWINVVIDAFTSLFTPGQKTRTRKPKMKVYGERSKDYDYNARKKSQNDEVDRILDKLKKSGYDSLTTDEKKSLFDASKR